MTLSASRAEMSISEENINIGKSQGQDLGASAPGWKCFFCALRYDTMKARGWGKCWFPGVPQGKDHFLFEQTEKELFF